MLFSPNTPQKTHPLQKESHNSLDSELIRSLSLAASQQEEEEEEGRKRGVPLGEGCSREMGGEKEEPKESGKK